VIRSSGTLSAVVTNSGSCIVGKLSGIGASGDRQLCEG